MTMNSIPLRTLEMKFIPKRLKGIPAEDDLAAFIAQEADWVRCGEDGWMDEILMAQLTDL